VELSRAVRWAIAGLAARFLWRHSRWSRARLRRRLRDGRFWDDVGDGPLALRRTWPMTPAILESARTHGYHVEDRGDVAVVSR
jgi:hypothetical protein